MRDSSTDASFLRAHPPSAFHAHWSSALGRVDTKNALTSAASSFSASPSTSCLSPAPYTSAPSANNSIHLDGTTSSSRSPNLSASAEPYRTTGFSVSSPRSGSDKHRTQSLASEAGSSFTSRISSSSLNRASADYQGHCAFFDDYQSPDSYDDASRKPAAAVFGLGPLRLNSSSTCLDDNDDDVDEEDLKDLGALKFSRSIRMNLEALTRSNTDHPTYRADGYSDPNEHLEVKAVNELHQDLSIEDSYAQLISRLASAETTHPASHANALQYRQPTTPRTFSLKDSPQAASLLSGRSSSDAHEDELRTPPEPGFDRFESSPEDDRRHEPSAQPSERSLGHPSLPAHASSTTSMVSSPSAFRLDSPFKPSQTHLLQNQGSQDRVYPQASHGRCDVGNSSELELLSDDVNDQRRAAGKARAMPWHIESSPSSESSHRSDKRPSLNYPVIDVESNKPFTRLGPQDIAFSASTLPERGLTAADCIEMVVSRYPSICDAPLREFGEDGQPLPPTKKQETSEEERQARREALQVKFCAKQRLSLIKAMVVMESRTASWKRLGPLNASNKLVHTVLNPSQQDPSAPSSHGIGRLPPMPSPWSMEIQHEQLDVAQIKGKSKKTIELTSLRTNAHCVKCDGSGLGACITCKAEKADECFWCCGTGREKTRAQAWCRRCQGAGVLKCNTCHGSLKSSCRACEGTGTGEYGFFVEVTVKRVEMPSVPVSTLFPQMDSASTSFEPSYDEVKAAATLALWDSITKLTEARAVAVMAKGSKSKSKEMVPVMAACMWENSITHVVAVDIPLAAKFKKGATPALRPEGLHRKIPTQRRFFTVPNDEDLRSVELSEDEVKKLGAPQPGNRHVYQSRSHFNSASQSPSYDVSPAASTVDLGGRPLLATPKSGGGVSGYSTPSRVPSPRSEVTPAKPAAKEFVHRPSPLSQLATATPAGSPPVLEHPAEVSEPYFGNQAPVSAEYHSEHQGLQPALQLQSRRPSAGHVLSKKLSSNLLNKLGAQRGSF